MNIKICSHFRECGGCTYLDKPRGSVEGKISLKYGYIITDPPGSGLSYKLVKRLRRTSPKRILYISAPRPWRET
jgi:hypothetical protein